MTGLAAVVLAHRDPAQVRRLIGSLAGVPVVLHCDAKSAGDVADEMLRDWGKRVHALPRMSGKLSSWSLMQIELEGIRAALRQSSAQHIAVMSGADYPLLSVAALHDRLIPWAGRSYLFSARIPYDSWSVPRHPDGGAWRFRHRFLTRGDDLITVRGIPARLPWRRPVPAGQELRASHAWKILCRDDAERLLTVVDTRPDIVAFWRSTFIPEESFVASVLSSPSIAGGTAVPLCHRIPWFMRWSERGAHHPEWLVERDWAPLSEAMRAPIASPDDLLSVDAARPQPMFARKFAADRSGALLDRIDAELR
ncbi:MAG: beta-1,6-N-acetylglucosaminyltransferase [Nakamurella sp.]